MGEKEKFFIITKESVRTLAEKLSNSTRLGEVKNEVEKMLEIKKVLLYRAERGIGVPKEIEREQAWEVQALEKIIDALKEKNFSEGISLIREYEKYSSFPEKGDELLRK